MPPRRCFVGSECRRPVLAGYTSAGWLQLNAPVTLPELRSRPPLKMLRLPNTIVFNNAKRGPTENPDAGTRLYCVDCRQNSE